MQRRAEGLYFVNKSGQCLLITAAPADEEAVDWPPVAIGLHRELVAEQKSSCNPETASGRFGLGLPG